MDQLVILGTPEQEYLLRIVESAAQVRDRRQFFLWSQGQLQALLPHRLLVCLQFDPDGALGRLESFHGGVLGPGALERLCDPETGLAVRLARHCGAAGALPCSAEAGEAGGVCAPFLDELGDFGFASLVAHGSGTVAGGATVFLLFGLPVRPAARHLYFLALLLPQLHLALGRLARPSAAPGPAPAPAAGRPLSRREEQVLHCLREGKKNEEIAATLGISSLTVKNHLHRIYRLLAVRNRTEALARSAMLRLPPRY